MLCCLMKRWNAAGERNRPKVMSRRRRRDATACGSRDSAIRPECRNSIELHLTCDRCLPSFHTQHEDGKGLGYEHSIILIAFHRWKWQRSVVTVTNRADEYTNPKKARLIECATHTFIETTSLPNSKQYALLVVVTRPQQ